MENSVTVPVLIPPLPAGVKRPKCFGVQHILGLRSVGVVRLGQEPVDFGEVTHVLVWCAGWFGAAGSNGRLGAIL